MKTKAIMLVLVLVLVMLVTPQAHASGESYEEVLDKDCPNIWDGYDFKFKVTGKNDHVLKVTYNVKKAREHEYFRGIYLTVVGITKGGTGHSSYHDPLLRKGKVRIKVSDGNTWFWKGKGEKLKVYMATICPRYKHGYNADQMHLFHFKTGYKVYKYPWNVDKRKRDR